MRHNDVVRSTNPSIPAEVLHDRTPYWSFIMQTQENVVQQDNVQVTEVVLEDVAPDFEVIKVEGCLSSTSL
jgi:hypothetical protein